MSNATAWILDCGDEAVIAVSAFNMLHVVEDAALRFKVPLTPAHCSEVLVWQQRVLPVIDLELLLRRHATVSQKNHSCVLGWLCPGDITEYGILATRTSPQRILVTDDKSRTPSAALADVWRGVALGFFEYQNKLIPIADPALVFGSSQVTASSRAPTALGQIA